jgi:hypothetical protein
MARTGKVHRQTRETDVSVDWELDGNGRGEIATTLPFLDPHASNFSPSTGFRSHRGRPGRHGSRITIISWRTWESPGAGP